MRIRLFQRWMRLRRLGLLLSPLSPITEPLIPAGVNHDEKDRFSRARLSVTCCIGMDRARQFFAAFDSVSPNSPPPPECSKAIIDVRNATCLPCLPLSPVIGFLQGPLLDTNHQIR